MSIEEGPATRLPTHMYLVAVSCRWDMYRRSGALVVSVSEVWKDCSDCYADMVQERKRGRVERHSHRLEDSDRDLPTRRPMYIHPARPLVDLVGPDSYWEKTALRVMGRSYLQGVIDAVG